MARGAEPRRQRARVPAHRDERFLADAAPHMHIDRGTGGHIGIPGVEIAAAPCRSWHMKRRVAGQSEKAADRAVEKAASPRENRFARFRSGMNRLSPTNTNRRSVGDVRRRMAGQLYHLDRQSATSSLSPSARACRTRGRRGHVVRREHRREMRCTSHIRPDAMRTRCGLVRAAALMIGRTWVSSPIRRQPFLAALERASADSVRTAPEAGVNRARDR